MVIVAGTVSQFVDLNVSGWAWFALVALIGTLVSINLVVVHRHTHEVSTKSAIIESAIWISIGLAFGGVITAVFGVGAAGEYLSGYLIEVSMSVDNIFVWALILGYFKIPTRYHHRVLFSGIFISLVLRAIFIFAGMAIVETFGWVLYIFGAFLLFSAVKLMTQDIDNFDPASSRFMSVIHGIVPTSPELDGRRLFTRHLGSRVATPLLAVLVLIEFTDVLFAIDSVPAVLAVSREQFLVFSSNAFAILALRSLYFLVADARSRFAFLNEGVAVILAFVGVKMLVHQWLYIPTWMSLTVIGVVLAVSIGLSLIIRERMPPIQER